MKPLVIALRILRRLDRWLAVLVVLPLLVRGAEVQPEVGPLPGTQRLTLSGDIASNLVAGVDRFLRLEIERSIERRAPFWHRDFSSLEAYQQSIQTNRQRLAHILGVRDARIPFNSLEFCSASPDQPSVANQARYEVHAVRWPAFGEVHGEGLLLIPRASDAAAASGTNPGFPQSKGVPVIIALPDADQLPEQIAGLAEGVPVESQFARQLAESGCYVIIPTLINRRVTHRQLSNREFLYRPAFELGRHLIGFEVQKVLALVDWLERSKPSASGPIPSGWTPRCSRIGVMGWGEGGLLALYAGALDARIDAVCVSGYFGPREEVWQEPVYRNVFGLLAQFGDAELASLIAPRPLVIEAARGPELVVPPGTGGAPGRLVTPHPAAVLREIERARRLTSELTPASNLELVVSGDGTGPFGTAAALSRFRQALAFKVPATDPASGPAWRPPVDAELRHRRQMQELDRHTQALLIQSPAVRAEFMKGLDPSTVENYAQSVGSYRQFFADQVIGRFESGLLPPNPRSRLIYERERWAGYEVVLDVFPEVIAYGILLLPKEIKPGEQRPVVVCQHGLEGRPQDIITGNHPAYHDFAAQLAERGFITFAPQNLYLFGDRFRALQRQANPLGKTLFSIIAPQHQQILNWLKSLPYVDPQRIGFYGLSYGGKTAMRVPALLTDYCLSICSADFNEWVWKNASTLSPYSYVWTGEYEIFEFDLGSTFNYAEMAALIAPRPFMVERGHFDGVAPDETVGYEFAKVRHLYEARLKLPDCCAIEWFVGPHTINGQGTFEFLGQHLQWPVKP